MLVAVCFDGICQAVLGWGIEVHVSILGCSGFNLPSRPWLGNRGTGLNFGFYWVEFAKPSLAVEFGCRSKFWVLQG